MYHHHHLTGEHLVVNGNVNKDPGKSGPDKSFLGKHKNTLCSQENKTLEMMTFQGKLDIRQMVYHGISVCGNEY